MFPLCNVWKPCLPVEERVARSNQSQSTTICASAPQSCRVDNQTWRSQKRGLYHLMTAQWTMMSSRTWMVMTLVSALIYVSFPDAATKGQNGLTFANATTRDIYIKVTTSRLPCFVFFLCMLTNKNPNANKLSWVIN